LALLLNDGGLLGHQCAKPLDLHAQGIQSVCCGKRLSYGAKLRA
jgi:hypothetical protein